MVVPGAARLRIEIDVEVARGEYPERIAKIIVNGEQVMHFRLRNFHSAPVVVFAGDKVGIAFEE